MNSVKFLSFSSTRKREFKAVNNSIPLGDMGESINQRILFSEIWDRVDHQEKVRKVKVQMTSACPHIYTNKKISPISIVLPLIVFRLLHSLANT